MIQFECHVQTSKSLMIPSPGDVVIEVNDRCLNNIQQNIINYVVIFLSSCVFLFLYSCLNGHSQTVIHMYTIYYFVTNKTMGIALFVWLFLFCFVFLLTSRNCWQKLANWTHQATTAV